MVNANCFERIWLLVFLEGHQLAAAWYQAFRSTDWSSDEEVTFHHHLNAQGVPETKRKFWRQWMERHVFLFMFQNPKLSAFRWIIPDIERKKKSIFNQDYIIFFPASHATFCFCNMLPICSDPASKYLCLSTFNTVASCFIF